MTWYCSGALSGTEQISWMCEVDVAAWQQTGNIYYYIG